MVLIPYALFDSNCVFQTFLNYTKAGSEFVFGNLTENIFAFQVSNDPGVLT